MGEQRKLFISCVECGVLFAHLFSRGRPPMVCSPKCSKAKRLRRLRSQYADNKAKSLECLWCHVGKVNKGSSKFCSKVCRLAANRHYQTGHLFLDLCVLKTCTACGLVKGRNNKIGRCSKCIEQSQRDREHSAPRRARSGLRSKIYQQGDKDINVTTLVHRHGINCWLCNSPVLLDVHKRHPLSPHVDHLIPISKGGSHGWDNVALAHASCNVQKGSRLVAFGRWGDSRPMRID